MIYLDRVPPPVAHAFEAHERATHDLAGDGWHAAEFERLHDALTAEHAGRLADLLAAARRGVEIVPRAAYSPLPWLAPADPPRVPRRWSAARIGGVWR